MTFSAVKPNLLVEAPKASVAVQFYKAAFDAEELSRSLSPKRKADQDTPLVLAAEIKIGDFTLIVSDDPSDDSTPLRTRGSGFTLYLETEDVEASVKQAVAAGAIVSKASDGEECCVRKSANLKDPFGFAWVILSPVKKSPDVSETIECLKEDIHIRDPLMEFRRRIEDLRERNGFLKMEMMKSRNELDSLKSLFEAQSLEISKIKRALDEIKFRGGDNPKRLIDGLF